MRIPVSKPFIALSAAALLIASKTNVGALSDAASGSSTSAGAITSVEHGPAGRYVLWYNQPATNWYEALPIGNGRMGAMVFGGTKTEHLQLNEDTMWSGGPCRPARASAREAIK